MNDEVLREQIIDYMSKPEMSSRGWFCTWWFKLHLPGLWVTSQVRRELERMELEGLCESDHSQANNTLWRLTK